MDALSNMSDGRLIEMFGGEIRIERLKQHFERLSRASVRCCIVSYGWSDVIRHALVRIGLDTFWGNATIVGADSPLMDQFDDDKADIIIHLSKKHHISNISTQVYQKKNHQFQSKFKKNGKYG